MGLKKWAKEENYWSFETSLFLKPPARVFLRVRANFQSEKVIQMREWEVRGGLWLQTFWRRWKILVWDTLMSLNWKLKDQRLWCLDVCLAHVGSPPLLPHPHGMLAPQTIIKLFFFFNYHTKYILVSENLNVNFNMKKKQSYDKKTFNVNL